MLLSMLYDGSCLHNTHTDVTTSGSFFSLFLALPPSVVSARTYITVSIKIGYVKLLVSVANRDHHTVAGIAQIEEQLDATPGQISWSLSIFILLQGCVPLLWSAVSEIVGRKVTDPSSLFTQMLTVFYG